MQSIKDVLGEQYSTDLFNRKKHVTKEYQDFGLRLADKLNDRMHKSLYIKLAKEKERTLLEIAFSFAIDYPNATGNKGRLFMWKLKELEKERKEKHANPKS
ncbi:MAG TPA: hypothetical protein VHA74_01105 [Candidatus Dojkabacteria bacterium]|nr:hypothetical protein [Candidatus Dojkabacteria bacterium]